MELIARYYETPTSKPIPIPVELGSTVQDLINGMQLPDFAMEQVGVYSDGELLSLDHVFENDITVVVGLRQGKGVINTIATIALVVAAPYLAPSLLGAVGIGATATTLAIAGAAITLVGSLVIGALIPPPDLGSGSNFNAERADDVYFVTGASNSSRLFQTVPSLYGVHKIFPDAAATPRVNSVGTESEVSVLLDLGLGDIDISDIRVGDTPIAQLGLEYKVHQNTAKPDLKWISDQSSVQQFAMVGTDTHQGATTAAGTTKIEMLFQFGQGLYHQNTDGSTASATAGINAEYSLVGSGVWTAFPTYLTGGKASVNSGNADGKSLEPFLILATVSDLTPGQYEVRFKRNSPVSTDAYTHHSYTLASLNSYKPGHPVALDKKHTLLEVHGIASEKLSGQIQTVNCIASRKVRDITATGWGAWAVSSNPALIALDILTCEENEAKLKDGQIDFRSWKHLRDICAGGKYTFNGLFRSQATVKEIVNRVLSNGRAQLNITQSGKIGVLVDEAGKTPVQMITPTNSWDFSGSRNFPDYPHALRVSYIEKAAGWQQAEVIVYDDGYSENNATKFEDLGTVGITDRQEAWRYGRFMMAQSKMRNETFSLHLDVESLVISRGDIVSVQHDTPKFGGISARVMDVAGAVVTIDRDISLTGGSLGARVRLADGTLASRAITATTDDTVTLDSSVAGLDYGDLIVIGEVGKETHDYIVLAVEPEINLAATLTLVKYVPEVYTADTGSVPDWDPGFGSVSTGTDLAIVSPGIKYSINYLNRAPIGHVEMTWGATGSLQTLEYYNVFRVNPDGTESLVTTTKIPTYSYKIDLLSNRDQWNKPANFRIEPVNNLGMVGTSNTTGTTVLPDITPPHDVDGFGVNIIGNVQCEIFWRFNQDPDIAYYDLRYTPKVTNAKWQEAQGLARVAHTTNRTSVGARTGTYFIIAVDTSGNKSQPVGLRTSVETLPNLDLLVNINDAPNWVGTLNNMQIKGGDLMLAGDFGSVVGRGIYQFDQLFDAGEVQELRVQSKMLVYGVTGSDIMSTWVRLSDVPALSQADADEFDAWLEVRTADKFRMMSDWTPLSSADPIGEAGQGWSPWRRVESADLTGRIFQFRVVAESSNPNVNLVVGSANVEIDVLERYESYPDVLVTDAAAGVVIKFDPAFRSVPTLAVTVDGNTHAIGYEVVSKTESQAVIKLHNEPAGVAATGKIDVAALGWGKQRSNPI